MNYSDSQAFSRLGTERIMAVEGLLLRRFVLNYLGISAVCANPFSTHFEVKHVRSSGLQGLAQMSRRTTSSTTDARSYLLLTRGQPQASSF